MAEIHALVARIVLVLVIVIAAWSVVLVAGGRPIRPALVGGLAWIVVLVAVTGLLGIANGGRGLAARSAPHRVRRPGRARLPGAWAISRARPEPRRTVLVSRRLGRQVILVIRLFQTGG
jgi:hypothetical protein